MTSVALKRVLELVDDRRSFRGDEPYVGLEHITSWTGFINTDDEVAPQSLVSVFQRGDVLFGKLRPYLAKVARPDFDGVVSTEALVLRSNDRILSRYLRYVLSSPHFINRVNAATFGVKMPRASWQHIGSELIYCPSREIQKSIADFLDRETARIDRLIEKKQRLVEVLGERYKVRKKHLVFDLDNQSVSRRASTVSWFPDLPSHWRSMRCAQIFNNLDHRRIPLSSEQRGDLAKIYPYYGASGIIDAVDDYLFDEDTILVGEDGANLVMQSTPIAFKATGKYWVNNHAHILTPRFGDFDYWIHALNQVPYEVFVTGAAQPKLTSAVLGNIRLPVPDDEEQTHIARQIGTIGQRTNAALKPICDSIDRLKEYRSALITAAVTGQIDVVTWGDQGSTERHLDQVEEEVPA